MNLKKLTIKSTRERLDKKEFSAKELVRAVYDRIDIVDPQIKAFVCFAKENAMKAAEKYDKKKTKSFVAGIPGSVKDNYNWKGTKTTASSKMLEDYVSPYNATVIQRLLDQDAVLIGKTNMDAFAHGSSTETSDFFTTLNPWDTSRLPGGSSGGSAAAVAAGMGVYSMGTETVGSVRGPAAWCGLTGFKPTYGRTSRYGVVAMGSSLDVPGPICKTAEDCAIILDVIAGQDKYDATSSPKNSGNYHKNLDKSCVKDMKIGVVKQYFDEKKIQREVIERAYEALKVLEKMGAKLLDIDLLEPKYGMAVYTVVCRSEVSSNLGRYDGIRYGHVSEVNEQEVLDQISHNRGEGFGNEAKQRSMTGGYALSAGYYDAYYKKAQKVRTLIIKDMNKAFEKVDIIAGPTMPSVAPKVGATEGNPLFGEMMDVLMMASSLSGTPGISLPVGLSSDNLPIGLNLMAPQFEEQRLLDTGYAYQMETDWHEKYTEF